MKSDPRACKIPMTEFDHLDMAEVARFERMERAGVLGTPYYWKLLSRRVDPDRGHNKGDAA